MEEQIKKRIKEEDMGDVYYTLGMVSKLYNKIITSGMIATASLLGTVIFISLCFEMASYGLMPFAAITSISMVLSAKRMINLISQSREIKKIEMFLENSTEINKKISSIKSKLSGISKKARKYVESLPNTTKRIIDVNSIDNFTLADLKNIRLNIQSCKNSSFDQPQPFEYEDKDQVKVLRPKNKK